MNTYSKTYFLYSSKGTKSQPIPEPAGAGKQGGPGGVDRRVRRVTWAQWGLSAGGAERVPRRPTRASTEVAAHGAAPSQRRVRSAMPAARREGLPRTQVSRGSARAPSHGPRGGLGPSPLPSYFPGTPNSPAARPPPPRTPPPPGPRSAFPQGPAGTGRGHVRSGPGSQAGASCPLIPAARSRGARARGARGRGTVRPRRRPRARIRPAPTRHADRAASSPQPAAGGDTCSADRSAGERGRG